MMPKLEYITTNLAGYTPLLRAAIVSAEGPNQAATMVNRWCAKNRLYGAFKGSDFTYMFYGEDQKTFKRYGYNKVLVL